MSTATKTELLNKVRESFRKKHGGTVKGSNEGYEKLSAELKTLIQELGCAAADLLTFRKHVTVSQAVVELLARKELKMTDSQIEQLKEMMTRQPTKMTDKSRSSKESQYGVQLPVVRVKQLLKTTMPAPAKGSYQFNQGALIGIIFIAQEVLNYFMDEAVAAVLESKRKTVTAKYVPENWLAVYARRPQPMDVEDAE